MRKSTRMPIMLVHLNLKEQNKSKSYCKSNQMARAIKSHWKRKTETKNKLQKAERRRAEREKNRKGGKRQYQRPQSLADVLVTVKMLELAIEMCLPNSPNIMSGTQCCVIWICWSLLKLVEVCLNRRPGTSGLNWGHNSGFTHKVKLHKVHAGTESLKGILKHRHSPQNLTVTYYS